MNQLAYYPRIKSFWNWFVQMEDRIANFFSDESEADKEALIETINNRVLDFGLFAWEVGAGKHKQFYFTLSPNGDKQRLQLSKSIIRNAPKLHNWEFHYAKPPKKWDYIFSIYDDFMMERSIEAFRWNYVLLEYPDDSLEIQIEANNIDFLDTDAQKAAADLVLTNILGEECKIEYLDKIGIHPALDDEYSAIAAPIRELREHVDEILAEKAEHSQR